LTNGAYETHKDVSQGNPVTWAKDDKFHDAEAGFAHGESNPVPLALVTCGIRNEVKDIWKRRYIFSSGNMRGSRLLNATRTSLLLTASREPSGF